LPATSNSLRVSLGAYPNSGVPKGIGIPTARWGPGLQILD